MKCNHFHWSGVWCLGEAILETRYDVEMMSPRCQVWQRKKECEKRCGERAFWAYQGLASWFGDQVKGAVCDSSKMWASVAGKMAGLLRNARSGDVWVGNRGVYLDVFSLGQLPCIQVGMARKRLEMCICNSKERPPTSIYDSSWYCFLAYLFESDSR